MPLNEQSQPRNYPPSLLSAVEAIYGCQLSNSGDRVAPPPAPSCAKDLPRGGGSRGPSPLLP